MGRRGGPDNQPQRGWLEETYGFATVHLGWQPGEFWAATPHEFWPAQQAFQRKIEAQNRK